MNETVGGRPRLRPMTPAAVVPVGRGGARIAAVLAAGLVLRVATSIGSVEPSPGTARTLEAGGRSETGGAARPADRLDRLLRELAASGDDPYPWLEEIAGLGLPAAEGLPVHLALLDDDRVAVRCHAARALAGYGPGDRTAVARLVRVVDDPTTPDELVLEAVAALAAIGSPEPEVVRSLADRLEAPDGRGSGLKLRVLEAVGALGPAACAARPVVARSLDDSDTAVGYAAFCALGEIEAAERPSPDQLDCIDGAERIIEGGYATFVAIQEAGPAAKPCIPPLATIATGRPGYLAAMATRTLGQVGAADPRAVEAMLVVVGSGDPFLADLAARSLAGIDPRAGASVGPLSTALRHRSPRVRRESARALKRFGPAAGSAIPALAEALGQSDGRTEAGQVAAYLEALRAVGPGVRQAADAIVRVLPERSALYTDRDKTEVIRLRAFMLATLAAIGVPEAAMPTVLDGLAHSTMAYSFAAAARAAGASGRHARRTVPLLSRALASDFHDDYLTLERYATDFPPDEATTGRIEAIRALGRIGPEAAAAVGRLEALAAQDDGTTVGGTSPAAEARDALRSIRGRDR